MDRFREEIDRIDAGIAELLDKRLDLAEKIGRYKEERGLPVLDEGREKAKAGSFLEHFDPQKRDCVCRVMEAIMAGSRKYQEKIVAEVDGHFDFALLGRGLAHSLSPQVHKALGGYGFGLIDIEEDKLDDFMSDFPLRGVTVTMPYKRAVMSYCSEISDRARAAGSVNTVVKREDGTLAGYNTDYSGFRYTVKRSGVDVREKKCLIFGSGGASGTVRKVLEDLGAGEVLIVSRNGADNYDNLNRHYDAEILVNATPVGMYPSNGDCLVRIEDFMSCCGVFDLIYNPIRSRLILDAEDANIPAFPGLEMLVAQAASACELFTGTDASDRVEEVCDKIRREQENIVLIGMPGSGKSIVGRKLAELTGKSFADTDEMIAKTFGKTPEEIILSEGEQEFRKKEMKLVERISREGGQVIAAGGGVVEDERNRIALKGNGKLVLVKRELCSLQTAGRPLSVARGVEEIYDRRKAKYENWSDLHVRNMDIDETAKEIRDKLGY